MITQTHHSCAFHAHKQKTKCIQTHELPPANAPHTLFLTTKIHRHTTHTQSLVQLTTHIQFFVQLRYNTHSLSYSLDTDTQHSFLYSSVTPSMHTQHSLSYSSDTSPTQQPTSTQSLVQLQVLYPVPSYTHMPVLVYNLYFTAYYISLNDTCILTYNSYPLPHWTLCATIRIMRSLCSLKWVLLRLVHICFMF